jgi:hypothetical protein
MCNWCIVQRPLIYTFHHNRYILFSLYHWPGQTTYIVLIHLVFLVLAILLQSPLLLILLEISVGQWELKEGEKKSDQRELYYVFTHAVLTN